MNKNNHISAITLLDSILEFIEMTEEIKEWNYESQAFSPPRLIRLQQIDVMLKKLMPDFPETFSLKQKIMSVHQGSFIKDRKREDYKKVFEEMDALLIDHKPKRLKYFEWSTHHLQRNYAWVLAYKKEIRKMKNYNWGDLETSYPYAYSNLLMGTISSQIDSSMVDHFLASVIDPFNQVFNKSTLIKKDGYPSVNLKKLDKEWV